MNGIGIEVVNPFQVPTHTDRPVDRRAGDAQHRLDLVEQLNGVANITVQLVHEPDNRCVSQATHIHQLDGSILNTFGTIDHHQGRIHRGQCAVGIF